MVTKKFKYYWFCRSNIKMNLISFFMFYFCFFFSYLNKMKEELFFCKQIFCLIEQDVLNIQIIFLRFFSNIFTPNLPYRNDIIFQENVKIIFPLCKWYSINRCCLRLLLTFSNHYFFLFPQYQNHMYSLLLSPPLITCNKEKEYFERLVDSFWLLLVAQMKIVPSTVPSIITQHHRSFRNA